jgi:ribose transport system ATP-binding protein
MAAAATRYGDDPAVPVMQVEGLSKSFGPVEVLRNIDLSFQPGKVHAIIGENGAGKSTLMKILAGHLAPTKARSASTASP